MVEPSTGMLIAYKLQTEAVMHFTSSKWSTKDGVNEVILPLPGLDTVAGTNEALYSYEENMKVDQEKFNNLFGFAHKSKEYIKNTTISFVSLLGMSILLSAASMCYYCKFKKIEQLAPLPDPQGNGDNPIWDNSIDEIQEAILQMKLEWIRDT